MDALARAEKDRIPPRRDLAIGVIMDRADDPSMTIDADYLTELNRLIYG
ncbi:MAG: hypothetical protein L0G85_04475 [Kocuria sp.]|nr:hypothetical protein [Kocuria sp.]